MITTSGGKDAGPSQRRRRAVKRTLTLLAVCGALLPAAAGAHPQYNPTSSNRYLKLSLAGHGAVRVAWSLMVGETPALPVRRKADANGDGVVDERELSGYAGEVARAVAAGVQVTVDGAPRAVAWDTPMVGLADRRVGPLPFSIDLVGRLPVAGRGPHLVTVDDQTPVDDLGESEIRVEEGPGTRLLAGWQGREDGGRQTRFVWNGPRFSVLEDRSIGFRFVDDTARAPRRAPLGLVGALLGAGAAAFLTSRGRRARRSR